MQNEISIKKVRKNTASLLHGKMYIILSLTGLVCILLFIFVFNPINHPWVVILFAIIAFTLVLSHPISRLIARNSKKMQIAYVKDMIKSNKSMAQFFRDQVAVYKQDIVGTSETVFKKINDDFGTQLADIDVEEETIRSQMKTLLEKAWNAAQEALRKTKDNDTKEEIRERYKQYSDSHLQSTEELITLLKEKREATSTDCEERIEYALTARERLVEEYYNDVEKVAKKYESQAAEWEDFLQENYN
ncbi:MAG: hypothetical protein KBB91_00010 [Candidatus Pacebacteria bacterium]|nr:hypothetical protein [Candidatus Paceibacterota bacterium]MBP9700779.1 hypothetical protein [Candidatus Paceibacterota bacterium]